MIERTDGSPIMEDVSGTNTAHVKTPLLCLNHGRGFLQPSVQLELEFLLQALPIQISINCSPSRFQKRSIAELIALRIETADTNRQGIRIDFGEGRWTRCSPACGRRRTAALRLASPGIQHKIGVGHSPAQCTECDRLKIPMP